MSNEQIQDLVQQGIELMAAQRFEAAKDVFERVIQADKRSFEAYLQLGNACVNLQQVGDGITAFKKALMVKPDSQEARYSLGCAYFLDGQNVEAVKQFNACEKAGFTSVEMYSLMEVIFLDAEDYVQAVRCANRAIRLEPLNPQPYLDKAQLFMAQGKTKEALSCLREVEDLLPDAAEPYVLETRLLTQGGDHDRAVEAIDRACKRFPEDGSLLLERGRALNAKGSYREALDTLNEAEKLMEGEPALTHDLAMQKSVAQAGLQNIDASIAELNRLVQGENPDTDALFLLLNECSAVGRFEDVLKFASQMLSIDGALSRYRAAALYWNAAALKELGRSDEAQEAFKKNARTLRQITIGEPGLIEVYMYRAMCHKELGEFDEALSLVDHLLALSPDDAVGYAFKADIYKAMGDDAREREMRDKVLAVDPDFKF